MVLAPSRRCLAGIARLTNITEGLVFRFPVPNSARWSLIKAGSAASGDREPRTVRSSAPEADCFHWKPLAKRHQLPHTGRGRFSWTFGSHSVTDMHQLRTPYLAFTSSGS